MRGSSAICCPIGGATPWGKQLACSQANRYVPSPTEKINPLVDKKEPSLASALGSSVTIVTKELLNSLQPPAKSAEQKQPEQKKEKSVVEVEKVLVETERKGMRIR